MVIRDSNLSRVHLLGLGVICLAFLGISMVGIGWGLPSRSIDPFLFAEDEPRPGEKIYRLSGAGAKFSPQRGADVDPDTLDRSGSGVRKIIHRFNAEGFASLADKLRVGRPRKRTDRYVALLKEAVQVNPRDLGCPFSCVGKRDCLPATEAR